MATITSQNWDGVTAPSIVVAGWTINASFQTETSQFVSSPNGLYVPMAFDGYKFATWQTQDGNSGDVAASTRVRLANDDRRNTGAVCIRGSASTLDSTTTTQYEALLFNDDYSGAGFYVHLIKSIAGVRTTLGTVNGLAADIIDIWCRVILTAVGTNLSVQVIRSTDGYYLNSAAVWGAASAYAIVATDSSITGQGYSGLYARAQGPGTNHGSTTYFDDFLLETATAGANFPRPQPQVIRIINAFSPQFTE